MTRSGGTGPRRVESVVRWTGRVLSHVYALDLDVAPEHFVADPDAVREWLPPGSPRTGVAVRECKGALELALYVDPRDAGDVGTVVEETSHLLCIAWHAACDRPVSLLALELQAEIDRFVFGLFHDLDPMRHFADFRWRHGLEPGERQRYETAHDRGHRYCRRLRDAFPARADRPGLLRELRDFYRASPQAKLKRAAVVA